MDDIVDGMIDEAIGTHIPYYGLAKKIVTALCGVGVDLDRLSRDWLLEAIPYLCQHMQRRFDQLPEQLKIEMAPYVADMMTQVLVDLQHTANSDHRRRLVNVLVQGVRTDWDLAEHQLLVRAVREMLPGDIEVLQGNLQSFTIEGRGPVVRGPEATPVQVACLRRLVLHGFVNENVESSTGFGGGGSRTVTYSRTKLGETFLEYLKDLGTK